MSSPELALVWICAGALTFSRDLTIMAFVELLVNTLQWVVSLFHPGPTCECEIDFHAIINPRDSRDKPNNIQR